jgi:hypothetical protein
MKARVQAYEKIKTGLTQTVHEYAVWVVSGGSPLQPVTHFCENITFVSQSEGKLFKCNPKSWT